jgi:ankyrin repeat protein
MDQTPREFTKEEALNYAAGSEAIRKGDVRRLAQLISEYPELLYIYAPRNLRQIGGRTLFQHLANWPGRWPRRLESAALLIAAGADIDYRGGDKYGETVLTEAVSCYDFSLTELLIEAGASPDGVDDDRRPMAEALFYKSPIAAKVLAGHGATIDLEFAAGLGRMDLMPTFFDADGNLLPSAGAHHPPVMPVPVADGELLDQALAYAAISGQVETGAFLVDHGADVNAKPSGFPHRIAIVDWAEGNHEFVQFLMQRGARPPEPDSDENVEKSTG